MANGVLIRAAVEGLVDEAVARRLIEHVGATPGDVYGKHGKGFLQTKISGYNNAARHAPWIILVDLDDDAPCASALRTSWLPDPAPHLCFRIAVHEVESWLLADPINLAGFIGVRRAAIPANPDSLLRCKEQMINLARLSRLRDIRLDMIPRDGSGRSEGPAYTSRLIEFVGSHWNPHQASLQSDSLRRAIECLRRLKIANELPAAE